MGDSASYGEFVNKVRACSSVCSKTCSRSRQHSTRSSSARRFFELAGQADATTSGGDNESSAGQLPTGGDTVLIAEGEWNGMPLSFECQSSQHELPRLQYFPNPCPRSTRTLAGHLQCRVAPNYPRQKLKQGKWLGTTDNPT